MYFQKLHDLEASIGTPWVVVVSEETPDGGKAGVATEVERRVAARQILERKARLATDVEAREYHSSMEQERAAAEQAALSGRVQLAVLSEQELRSLKASLRPQKG
jgi:D-serine deaminase-like pyridoxal phosphate-dependent protein